MEFFKCLRALPSLATGLAAVTFLIRAAYLLCMSPFRVVLCMVCRNSFPSSYYAEFVCPVCTRKAVVSRLKERLGRESFFGSSPAPFIGRFGYPVVNVGILSPGEVTPDAWMYDAPSFWAEKGLSVSDVVDYRAALVNMRSKASIRAGEKVIGLVQEIAMSSKPVDVEASFRRKPFISLNFSSFNAPTGPVADVSKIGLASNPKIDSKVEKVYSESDLKAVDALSYLYDSGYDVNFLSRLLSASVVGLKPNRRLVPTRFSITAVDDIVGRRIVEDLRSLNPIDEHFAFFGGYLGNYFLVMFFPDVWSFELFEAYANGDDFTTDFEPYSGRKGYAENCVGGYYASRLPVLERLSEMKRQSSVLVIRIITDEYLLPLGVWVVREAVRKALASKPVAFSSSELMLKYADALISRKFGYKNVQKIVNTSRLLAQSRQARLSRFF